MAGFIGTILKNSKAEMASLFRSGSRGPSVMGAIAGTGAFAGKMALGTTLGRTALGGAVGGIHGAVTDDSWSMNGRFDAAVRGALGGAAIGLGASVAWKSARYADDLALRAVRNPAGVAQGVEGLSKGIVGMGPSLARGGIGATKAGLGMAGSAINFAASHPLLVAGAAGLAYGAGGAVDAVNDSLYGTSVLQDSPYDDLTETQMNIAMKEEVQAANSMSMGQVSPMGGVRPARASLMASTNGLVQGLHRGRHR